ncbi:methyltransferase domain-containing protein [Candidatus Woesearchaeota archaeon]|nr:methyltransferase domain-containing protein [Candidatus Woesearchaeota archaeon]
MRLNLGCGEKPMKGYLNVDVVKWPGVDMVLDIEKTPWPFPENHFEEVRAENVLEHVHNLDAVMAETERVLKPDGVFSIIVPHFHSHLAFTDPYHVRFFAPETFNYYCDSGKVKNVAAKTHFKIQKIRLVPGFWGRMAPPFLRRSLSYVFGNVVDYIEATLVKSREK